MYYRTNYDSPIGAITLACADGRLAGLWFNGQKYYGDSVPEPMIPNDDLPVFHMAKNWLDRYFSGQRPDVDELPLAPIGGAFRQMVWRILREISYGEVTTYGEIAKRVAAKTGRPMSGQAVGGAVGHNPISIIIPCHRVVGANGSLTGYAGGIAVKRKLLELEGVDTDRFRIPRTGTAL